jgi:hypothetical protein
MNKGGRAFKSHDSPAIRGDEPRKHVNSALAMIRVRVLGIVIFEAKLLHKILDNLHSLFGAHRLNPKVQRNAVDFQIRVEVRFRVDNLQIPVSDG